MQNFKQIVTVLIVVLMSLVVATAAYAGDVAKIDINRASAEELTHLKGVGEKYAEAIIHYREEHGPFTQAEDITKVSGIGPKTFEANKECITVE